MSTFPLTKFQELKTPFYYYDMDLLNQTLKEIMKYSQAYDYHVHYAIKANANKRILKSIQEAGLGADCVSGAEIERALECGFKAGQIAFAGVGKTDEEINIGLKNDIFSFNCESLAEIEVLNELANKAHKVAKVAVRFNPNVNAKTHHYITTGLEENKFGINKWELEELLILLEKCKNIQVTGLHFHIGSQITDLSVFKGLCLRVNEVQKWFREQNFEIQHVNVGGGLGVNYVEPEKQIIPEFKNYFNIFHKFLKLYPGQKLHFELGRAVVAQCGTLMSRVLFIKKGINTNFAILDAGMTELIRPALYQSHHKIENLSKSDTDGKVKYDVVGPICESSDCFGKAIELPTTERGDLIAIRTAGAYGEVMSSNYNLRSKVKTYYNDEL